MFNGRRIKHAEITQITATAEQIIMGSTGDLCFLGGSIVGVMVVLLKAFGDTFVPQLEQNFDVSDNLLPQFLQYIYLPPFLIVIRKAV